MIQPQELVSAVEFKPSFDRSTIGFNERLGFLEVRAEDVAAGSLRYLGFATPFAAEGGLNRDNFVTPLTWLDELPRESRTVDLQGKGVGPRLYNLREPFAGEKQKPAFIGVYTFDVRSSALLDMRAKQGGKLARIGRHAGRIVRSKLGGLESVVQGIHNGYSDEHWRKAGSVELDAVELEVPPHPQLRQARRGVKSPEGITPAFMIIRNPHVILRKVGETDAPWND